MTSHPAGYDTFFLLRDEIGPGSFVCRAQTEIGDGWWHLRNPRKTLIAWKHADVIPLLEAVEAWAFQSGFAAGYVAYEASPAFDAALVVHPTPDPLAIFHLYDNPPTLHRELGPSRFDGVVHLEPDITSGTFMLLVKEIREALADGRTYQTNFTHHLHGQVHDALGAFFRLCGTDPAPYATYIATDDLTIASFSPELFFAKHGTQVTCRPMKGTAPRFGDPQEDAQAAEFLKASEKERAENLMIVDMIRNDLGRIAETGSVVTTALFGVESHRTVLQMTSTVTAQTRASLLELFKSLFPCASVTGAPKVETMRLITSLENSARGVYTGALGWVGPNDSAQFSVAIRTLEVEPSTGRARFGVGSGIVWDSSPAAEWDECRLKSAVLVDPPTEWALLETMLWLPDEGVTLDEAHLDRMSRSALKLGLPFDRELATTMLQPEPGWEEPMRIRLTMNPMGQFHRTFRRFMARSGPVRAIVAKRPILSTDPALVIKSTSRWLYDSFLDENPQFDEVLLINERGELTEFTIGNLVVEVGGRHFTPPLSSGVLPGVMREALIELERLEEAVLLPKDLTHAEAIWRINSVSGFTRMLMSSG